MRIWYRNLIDADAVVISATSEVATLPATNLKHDFRKKVFRSNSTPASFTITFDFIGASALTSCYILDHTIDPTCTIYIEASSNNFATTAYSNAVAWAETLIISAFASQTYRYWRIRITHAAVPIFDIGRVFFGTYTTLTDEPEYEDYSETLNDPSRTQQTLGGQVYVEEVEQSMLIELNWRLALQATYDALGVINQYCGKGRSFLYQLDTVVTPFVPYYYVRQETELKVSAAAYTDAYNATGDVLWDLSMRLREQV